MDRLPIHKVRELWSSIHIFFAEKSYEKISVIVPFDRAHIINAFKVNDGENGIAHDPNACFGNDFIDKTFDIVYRVSPPILTDWRKFFMKKWEYAFGEDYDKDEYARIIQIYSLQSKHITPRRIIAFINEFVAIKKTNTNIQGQYMALYILNKVILTIDPVNSIIGSDYIKNVEFIYSRDNDRFKYIGALVYQINPESAEEVIFSEKLKSSLDQADDKGVTKMGEAPFFNDIISLVITKIENIGNAINGLYNSGVEVGQQIWDDFGYRLDNDETIDTQIISDYQLKVIERVTFRNRYLQSLLKKFREAKTFKALDYLDSIDKIKAINTEKNLNLTVNNALEYKVTTPEDFVGFVRKARGQYKDYKVICVKDKLDEYLVSKIEDVNSLEDVDYISYIKVDYPLKKYEKQLCDLAANSKNTSSATTRVEEYASIYDKIKEVTKDKPFKSNSGMLLDDASIYTLWTNVKASREDYDFYYDLLAMRIVRGTNFTSNYISYFEDVLKSDDAEIAEGVAERIEYYTTYENILIGLESFSIYPLYCSIVNKLTVGDESSPYGSRTMNLKNILQKYPMIIEKGQIDPSHFIKTLNNWQQYKEQYVKAENIKDIIDNIQFFEDAKNVENKLTAYIFDELKKYLDGLSKDAWDEALEDTDSYEVQTSLLLDEYTYEQNAINAVKSTLQKIQKGDLDIPNRNILNQILSRTTNESKSTEFKNIRDRFCTNVDITPQLFLFFGDWLFMYADMEGRDDVIRKILTSEILNNAQSIALLAKYTTQIVAIIARSKEDEVNDFKNTIRAIYTSGSPNAEIIAKAIGVRKGKKQSKEEIDNTEGNKD